MSRVFLKSYSQLQCGHSQPSMMPKGSLGGAGNRQVKQVPSLPSISRAWLPHWLQGSNVVSNVIILNSAVVFSPTAGLALCFRSCQSTLSGKKFPCTLITLCWLTIYPSVALSVGSAYMGGSVPLNDP